MRYRTYKAKLEAQDARKRLLALQEQHVKALREESILRAYEEAFIEVYGTAPFIVKKANRFYVGRNSMYLQEIEYATRILQAKLHEQEMQDGEN